MPARCWWPARWSRSTAARARCTGSRASRCWASLAYAALVLSGLGTWLLLALVRCGRAANAAALMFLAPPLAAVQAALLFGDHLVPLQWLGMAVAGAGVWLCQTQGRTQRAEAR